MFVLLDISLMYMEGCSYLGLHRFLSVCAYLGCMKTKWSIANFVYMIAEELTDLVAELLLHKLAAGSLLPIGNDINLFVPYCFVYKCKKSLMTILVFAMDL